AVSHTGMNLFNVARNKRERAEWSAQAYLRASVSSAVTGLARGRHSLRIQGKQFGLTPWGALGYVVEESRFLGEETMASSLRPIVESYLRTGNFSQASKIVSDNLQYLLAMRTIYGTKSLVQHEKTLTFLRKLIRRDPTNPESIQRGAAATDAAAKAAAEQ